jgi:hypothetical protein
MYQWCHSSFVVLLKGNQVLRCLGHGVDEKETAFSQLVPRPIPIHDLLHIPLLTTLSSTLFINREPIAIWILKQHVVATIPSKLLGTASLTASSLNSLPDLSPNRSATPHALSWGEAYLINILNTLGDSSNQSFSSQLDHLVNLALMSR